MTAFLEPGAADPFSGQFEADGDGFIYRKNGKGPAYRLTAAEHDAFLTAYKRQYRYMIGGVITFLMLWIFGMAFFSPETDKGLVVGAGVALIVIMVLIWTYRLFDAPAQELSRRSPSAPALGAKEVRDLQFTKLSYGQMGLGLLIVPLIPARMWKGPGSFDGWGAVWPAMAAGLFLLIIVQAVRKYLHERR